MRGWVYVITNKAMPGLVKVGFSLKDPDLRARELDNTGAPHPYEVAYEALVPEPRDVEQKVHANLTSCREGKEWFKCDAIVAIEQIRNVVGRDILLETNKSGASATRTNGNITSNDLYTCPVCHTKNKAPPAERVAICKQCGLAYHEALKMVRALNRKAHDTSGR